MTNNIDAVAVLRAALKELTDMADSVAMDHNFGSMDNCIEAGRAALAATERAAIQPSEPTTREMELEAARHFRMLCRLLSNRCS